MNEGQFAQVVCIVTEGDEPLDITWSLQGEIVSSEPGLTTTALGTRTSMLTIQSVGYRHSGSYTCTASNKAGSTSQSVDLQVNGIKEVAEKMEVGSSVALDFLFALYVLNAIHHCYRTSYHHAPHIWCGSLG